LFSSILGAIAGIGGGVIIKPTLDLLKQYDLATIGVLSSATVLSMSVVSLVKALKLKIKLNVRISLLLAGSSIIGGLTGQSVFRKLLENMTDTDLLGAIQSVFLTIIMIIILVIVSYTHKFKLYKIENIFFVVSCGLILGTISSFLGIGGGPLNVTILILLFGMNVKEAGINSVFIIFFSQFASLFLVSVKVGFVEMDLNMLPMMIAGGIIGGFIGAILYSKSSVLIIAKVFKIVIMGIILLNLYNTLTYFITH